MNKILITFLLCFVSFVSFAQEPKKGCDPKACKPGNTKVEEAYTITSLRESLVAVKKDFHIRKLTKTVNVSAGKDESESLEIIALEINQLEKLSGRAQTNFNRWTGAKLVSRLESALTELTD